MVLGHFEFISLRLRKAGLQQSYVNQNKLSLLHCRNKMSAYRFVIHESNETILRKSMTGEAEIHPCFHFIVQLHNEGNGDAPRR